MAVNRHELILVGLVQGKARGELDGSQVWAVPVDGRRDKRSQLLPNEWIAELDVRSHPQLQHLRCGPQREPLTVWAHQSECGERIAHSFHELPIEEGFDLGVLLVHGIGQQASAQTVIACARPIERWINGWWNGVTAHIATRLDIEDVRGWLLALQHGRLPGAYSHQGGQATALAIQFRNCVRDAKVKVGRTISSHPDEHARRFEKVCREVSAMRMQALGGRAYFSGSSLLDVGRPLSEPAHAELSIEALQADGYLRRTKWLLAEAHWATTFYQPKSLELAGWSLRAGPIAFYHAYRALSRQRSHFNLISVLVFAGLAALLVLMQFALVALTLGAIVPLAKWQSFLVRLQRKLTGVLGDSYVFANDSVQQRAMIDRVNRDLRWTLARCRKVVVVAHSQGAAVVQKALSELPEAQGKFGTSLAEVVTLGSGVRLLQDLEPAIDSGDHRTDRPADRIWIAWSAIVGTIALGVGVWLVASEGSFTGAILSATGLIAMGVAYWHAGAWRSVGDGTRTMGSLSWTDFFASHDPVPLGRYTKDTEVGTGYGAHEVHNRGSWLADHGSYWQNPEQFVGPLVRRLATLIEYEPMSSLPHPRGEANGDKGEHCDSEVMSRAASARTSRVKALSMARWIAGACALALLVVHVRTLEDAIRWITQNAPSGASPLLSTTSWPTALLPAMPILAYMLVIVPVWELWGKAELTKTLKREGTGTASETWVALFAFAVAGLVTLTAGVAGVATARGLAFSWLLLASVCSTVLWVVHSKAVGE